MTLAAAGVLSSLERTAGSAPLAGCAAMIACTSAAASACAGEFITTRMQIGSTSVMSRSTLNRHPLRMLAIFASCASMAAALYPEVPCHPSIP